jgi:hypothetical protein
VDSLAIGLGVLVIRLGNYYSNRSSIATNIPVAKTNGERNH